MRRCLLSLSSLLLVAGCGLAPCKGSRCGPDPTARPQDGGSRCGVCPASTPTCDETRAVCVACTDHSGCAGATPVCDPAAASGVGACVACTPTRGCSGATPRCFTLDAQPRCVQCLLDSQCLSGRCNQLSLRCDEPDAGAPLADASTPDDAGTADVDAGTGSGTGNGGVCIAHATAAPCGLECGRGFSCLNNQCVLNGGQGPLQVTLRWNTDEDVDLHVLEPTATGPCDVYYGNVDGTACGALGTLDLDSNAGCSIDSVDIENVIYPPGATVTSGVYTVKVDHYENCSSSTHVVPYEVEVRQGSTVTGYCGSFRSGGPSWNNGGTANSGVTALTFVVP